MEASAARGTTLIAPAAGRAKIQGTPGAEPDALDLRRSAEQTPEWKQTYCARSGIEGLNAALKRTTGMRRLRVRGTSAVGMSIHLKVTGWNIQTAVKTAVKTVRSRARRAKLAQTAPQNADGAAQNPRHVRPRRKRRVPSWRSGRIVGILAASPSQTPNLKQSCTPRQLRFCARILGG